jgi:hypothetical protein
MTVCNVRSVWYICTAAAENFDHHNLGHGSVSASTSNLYYPAGNQLLAISCLQAQNERILEHKRISTP